MAESMSKEVYFLNQVANQKYNKDFAVNMVQVNNTLKSISKYLIVMQKGIDDLNRDILEIVRDLIRELIVIFNGGDLSSLDFEWGDLGYVLQAIGQFFGFPLWSGSGNQWNPLQMAEHFVKNFVNFFVEAIKNIFGPNGLIRFDLLPTIPLSLFAPTTPNLLANGSFSGPESMAEGNGWMYDPSTGRDKLGSARYVVIPGERGVQLSTPVQVAENQKVDAETWAKWAGVSGSGSAFTAAIWWYSGTTKLSETLVGSVTSPAANGDWTQIKKSGMTAPANADSMCLALIVESNVTNGSIWFDDCVLKKPATSFPQQFVTGLVEGLSDLWDGVEDAFDWIRKLIGSFTGTIRDGIDDAIQDAIKFVSQLGEILAGGNPLDILPTLAGHTISTIKTTINQIGDVFNGIVVTPINNIVTSIRDWFLDLVGWKGNTTTKHQNLVNEVWSGVTQKAPEIDKTPEEVKEAVATLKARSDSLRTENELRYSSSVAIWQGPVPGGDVTCPVSDGLVIDASYPDGGGSRAHRVATTGRYVSSIAVFRARSSVQRDVITFLAKAIHLYNMSDFRVLLWSYQEDDDEWEIVAMSENVFSEVSTQPFWIDAKLQESYTPYIGELMGVSWWADDGQIDIASSHQSFAPQIPAYNSVPYGTSATASYPYPYFSPAVGVRKGFTKEDETWFMDAIPFAQVAPDLGQIAQQPPQYWFDDFNTPGDTAYNYTGNGNFSSGSLKYVGSADGVQKLFTNSQMSTDRMRIEATCTKPTAMHAKMIIHCSSDGKYGVELRITNVGIGLWLIGREGIETRVVLNSRSITAGARIALEFDPTTSKYRGYMGGALMFEWADLDNSAYRGRGRRSAGLGVCRDSFVNSAAWDDLLVFDVTD